MKRFVKKMASLTMAAAMAIGLAACGNSGGSQNAANDTNAGAQSDAPKVASKDKVVIKLGHGQPIESAANQAMLKMAEEVNEKSGATLELQVFPANQLGNERDLAEGLVQGTIDMSYLSTAILENFDSKLALFSLPYIFESYDHVHAAVASEVGEEVFGSLLETQSIRYLGFMDQGFRWIWNNDKPINTLEDLKGLKLRAPESPVYVSTFTLLGSNPMPIPWGEIYTAMQTKVVNGYEVYPESTIASKLYEVCKYGSKSNHIFAGSIIVIRDDRYNALSDEHRTILEEAVKNCTEYNSTLVIENEQQYIDEAVANGMEINDIAPEELKRFAEAVEPMYADYADKLSGMELIEKAKNAAY